MDRCLDFVLPAMLRQEPVVAWVVDDTGFPKKGHESELLILRSAVVCSFFLWERSLAQPSSNVALPGKFETGKFCLFNALLL